MFNLSFWVNFCTFQNDNLKMILNAAWFLDKWLNRIRCQEVRLLHELKKLIVAIVEVDHLEKKRSWNFFSIISKFTFLLKKLDKTSPKKKKKILPTVFTRNILWVISRLKFSKINSNREVFKLGEKMKNKNLRLGSDYPRWK